MDPVKYQIEVSHWLDGEIQVHVRDIEDDQQARLAVAAALRLVADEIEGVSITHH